MSPKLRTQVTRCCTFQRSIATDHMKWRPLLYRSPSHQPRQAIAPAQYSNLKCVSRLCATLYVSQHVLFSQVLPKFCFCCDCSGSLLFMSIFCCVFLRQVSNIYATFSTYEPLKAVTSFGDFLTCSLGGVIPVRYVEYHTYSDDAIVTNLLTYIFTCLLIYLFIYLFIYLLIYLLIYFLTYLLTYIYMYVCTYIHTYLHAPWSRVLHEKLTYSEPVNLFSAFYETRQFISAYTLPSPVPLLVQITPVHAFPSHFLKIHFNIILPSLQGSSKWSISLKHPHQNPVCTYSLPCTCHMSCPSHSS